MRPHLSHWLRIVKVTTLLCLVAAACTQPAQPSEAFTSAHARFIGLYAKHGEEAFLFPEMDGIESELRRVPSDSLDGEPARELLQRIQKGRASAIARGKEIEQAVARATAPPPPSASEPERPPSPRRFEPAPTLPVPEAPPPQEPGMLAAQPHFPDASETKARQEAKLAQEEASWRRRFQEANSRVTQIQNKISEVQRGKQSNGMPVTAFQTINCNLDKTVCTRTEYNENTQRSGLEKLKSMLAQAENALADLEREASAQNVPREWRR